MNVDMVSSSRAGQRSLSGCVTVLVCARSVSVENDTRLLGLVPNSDSALLLIPDSPSSFLVAHLI